jgi:NYN domain
MDRTNVYVDGFNLFNGALKGSAYKWLDLETLAHRLLPKDNIRRVRYFTARVSARPDDLQLPARQDAYLRALATRPTVSIHLGVFYVSRARAYLARPPAFGPKTVEIIKTEEKGSDVALATYYLMLDACRGDCETAVVVTNDSDLREPLRLARDELGLTTGVINPHAARRRSRALPATFFKQLRPGVLAASQLPAEIIDQRGHRIVRPASW